MSLKQNDTYIEQRKEAIKEKIDIIEEAGIKGRTAGGYGLRRVMSLYDELEMLNKGLLVN